MLINKIEFTEFEKSLSKTGKSFKDVLAPALGKVYVVAITRDGCAGCARQKPKIQALAKTSTEKYGSKVVFTQIHVKRPNDSDEESLRSKDVLGHYFYPTDLILVRTKDKGAVELYRSVSPEMAELKRKIETSAELAAMLKE